MAAVAAPAPARVEEARGLDRLVVVGSIATVRNTFLHFQADEEEELMLVKRSSTRSKTLTTLAPLSLTGLPACCSEGEDDVSCEVSEATPPTTARGASSGSDDGHPCSSTEPLVPSAAAPMEVARGVVLERTAQGGALLQWSVEERRISGQDKMFVSPSFYLSLPNLGRLPFKLILHAAAPPAAQKKGKGAQGFRSAEGWVRVELKCCDDLLPGDHADICLSIGMGLGDLAQPVRGPVVHNLAQQSMCGLPKGEDAWHMPRSIDHETRRATVLVAVEPAAA